MIQHTTQTTTVANAKTVVMVGATTTNLHIAAQALVKSAIHTVKFESTAHQFTFVAPCTGLDKKDENILESASILIAARTLSKLGRSGAYFYDLNPI